MIIYTEYTTHITGCYIPNQIPIFRIFFIYKKMENGNIITKDKCYCIGCIIFEVPA